MSHEETATDFAFGALTPGERANLAEVRLYDSALDDAIKAAEANNRTIRVAQLEWEKTLEQVQVARTYRLPRFSLIALGSQSLTRLGLGCWGATEQNVAIRQRGCH